MLKRPTSLTALVFIVIAAAAAIIASGCNPASGNRTNGSETSPEILVLAASDLKNAFTVVADRLEKKEGIQVKYSFGSTGQLARQIEAGARADVFAAANVQFVDQLESRELIITDTQEIYAIGRIVIWSPSDASFHPAKLEDLTDPRIERVAIANPDHAPYGKAAKEALQKAGVWEQVSKKIVLGENASQTLQFGESGNVDAAIVPLSLTAGSDGTFELVPENMHNPLRQSIAVLAENGNEGAARKFVDFVTGPDGREILKASGFQLP